MVKTSLIIGKKSNTAERLKEIMNLRGLKQIDIVNAAQPFCEKYGVKLGRNDVSQYCAGKVEPNQRKLTILALALNVPEVWLMGYDEPIKARDFNGAIQKAFASLEYTNSIPPDKRTAEILKEVGKLTDDGKVRVLQYIHDLSDVYRRKK
jgi:transcriptional regulator with XRE-family HTH domain